MDELEKIIEQLQLMNEDLRESNDKADQKEHYIRELQIKQLKESRDEGKTPDADLKLIPDAKIFVQKQRNFQFEGSFNFWYDPKGLRYKESP